MTPYPTLIFRAPCLLLTDVLYNEPRNGDCRFRKPDIVLFAAIGGGLPRDDQKLFNSKLGFASTAFRSVQCSSSVCVPFLLRCCQRKRRRNRGLSHSPAHSESGY